MQMLLFLCFRIKSWKTDTSLDRKEAELSNSNLCTSCGHSGKVQKHTKSGCVDCGTTVKCNDSFRYIFTYNNLILIVLLIIVMYNLSYGILFREKRMLLLNEIALRKKALRVEDFPNQELIDEFLIRKDPTPTKIDIQWKQPQINKFIVSFHKMYFILPF